MRQHSAEKSNIHDWIEKVMEQKTMHPVMDLFFSRGGIQIIHVCGRLWKKLI